MAEIRSNDDAEVDKATDDPPVLTQNDGELLQAMLELNATADSPCSSDEILAKAGWDSEGKRAFDRLKEFRYVESQMGVGRYLTNRGILRAKNLVHLKTRD